MGDKVNISPLTVEDNSSYQNGLNQRLDTLADEFDKVLYRDGSQDLQNHLNANSKRIYNLPAPQALDDPLRLRDLVSTFNPSEVALQALLAGAAGAGMIGYKDRTVYEKFEEGRVSVADKIPKALWNGMLSGTQADVTQYVQAALDECVEGSTLYFPFCLAGYFVSLQDNGLDTVFVIPDKVNVICDEGAWIYPSTDDFIVSVFAPLGNNVFEVNIDGRSIAEEVSVGAEPQEDRSRVSEGGTISTWVNYSIGIRAYATPELGLGAPNVTITNSRFRNLHHAIQTEGCSEWHISHNRFERIELAAVWFSYFGGNSANNSVMGNYFREIGDMACTWVSQQGDTYSAYNNKMNHNTAIDTQLNVYGFAFNVEPGGSLTTTVAQVHELQHHFQIIGNTVEQIYHADRPEWCYAGGVTMLNCAESIIAHNTLIGCLNSPSEAGISSPGCRGLQLHDNQMVNFRGGGIYADSCTDSEIYNNYIRNCGGNSVSTSAIIIANEYSHLGITQVATRVTVKNNKIIFTNDYSYGSESVACIMARTWGGHSTGITIENNEMVSPWGVGLSLNGNLFGNRISNVALRNNRVFRTDSTAGWGTAISIAGIDYLLVDGTELNSSRFGYIIQISTNVTVKNGRQAGASLYQAYDFSGSEDVRVENMSYPSGASFVIGGTAGTNVTHWKDDLVAPAVYADNAAAVTAGVPLHREYWNGTSVAIRT